MHHVLQQHSYVILNPSFLQLIESKLHLKCFFTLKVYQYQEWNTFNVKNLLEVFCLNIDQEKTEKRKG